MTVATVAQMEGISEATLYNWRNQAKSEGKAVPGADKTTDQWSAEARFVPDGTVHPAFSAGFYRLHDAVLLRNIAYSANYWTVRSINGRRSSFSYVISAA